MTPSFKTTALIVIGNEMLTGRTVDANMSIIARRMEDLGLPLSEVRFVKDDTQAIVSALTDLKAQNAYVFTTGGIGPTHDDVTVEAIATFFNTELEEHPVLTKRLQEHYRTEVLPQGAKRMTQIPAGARLIETAVSVVPAFFMGNVFCFGGVPRVLQISLEAAIPFLSKGQTIHTRSLDVLAEESTLAGHFDDIMNEYADVEIGAYIFRLSEATGTSIVGRSVNKQSLDEAFEAITEKLAALGVSVRL